MRFDRRKLILLLNVKLIIAAIALCIFSIVRLIMVPAELQVNLLLLAGGVMSVILAYAFYIYRKSRFPVSGIDYK